MADGNDRPPGEAAGGSAEEKESEGLAGTGSLSAECYDVEDVLENAEPWDPIETKIVLGSFAAAIFFLAIFGYLINIYILD